VISQHRKEEVKRTRRSQKVDSFDRRAYRRASMTGIASGPTTGRLYARYLKSETRALWLGWQPIAAEGDDRRRFLLQEAWYVAQNRRGGRLVSQGVCQKERSDVRRGTVWLDKDAFRLSLPTPLLSLRQTRWVDSRRFTLSDGQNQRRFRGRLIDDD
jgi:hypothetical protein